MPRSRAKSMRAPSALRLEEVSSVDARRDADEVRGRPGYVAGPWGSSTSRLHARGDVAAKSSRSEVDWSADWGSGCGGVGRSRGGEGERYGLGGG